MKEKYLIEQKESISKQYFIFVLKLNHTMKRIKDKTFYTQPAEELAQELLGMVIVRKNENGELERYRITTTEAYCGEKDKACHSRKGRTERTKVMFGKGGLVYVYLIYGIHWLFNIVANNENSAEAVLICGLDRVKGSGRVGKLLKIDKSFYGEDLITSERIWLEKGEKPIKYKSMPRVGIDYAKEWKDKPLRFECFE